MTIIQKASEAMELPARRESLLPPLQPRERRLKPRVKALFRVVVRGRRIDGTKFEEETRIENISATGIYLSLQTPVCIGTRFLALVFMSPALSGETPGPTIAALGTVVRTELIPGGMQGVGVHLNRYRFL